MYKLITIILCFMTACCSAQDPKFSQYFASPLTLNPAYTGFFDGNFRFALNTRQQWANLGDPYNTYSVSGDVKLVRDENFTNSIFSIGLSGLFDESFNKALRSQYVSLSGSYYQYLDVQHRFKFGLAPQVSYVSRFLDYNKLTFASQYNGNDFDLSMPNYLDLQNDRVSYFDLNVGANFSATFERISLVLGYARYHLTRPTETFLGITTTEMLPRKTVNFGLLYLPNNYVDLNFSAIYHHQGRINDKLGGFVIGVKPNEVTKLKLSAGLWYKFNESSYYPYFGITFGNVTAGVNYTVYANRILNSTPRTYEISFIYQHNNFKGFKVPCPKF